MARLARSVIQSTAANFASIGVAIALVIIVSRLLPPEVVGSFVMAFAVVFFVDQMREFQLPSYVAQLGEVDAIRLGAIRSVSLATSGLAILVCLVAAGLFQFAFNQPVVAECIALMTLGFILRPWSQPALAILARDMRYGGIAAVKLAASSARLAVTLGLILFADMGAPALAWGVVAEFTVEAAAVGLVPRDVRFSPPGRDGLGDIFQFCSQFTLATTLTQIAVALAPILIGGYQGLALAALYNRGTAVIRLLRSGVERAVLVIAVTEFSKDRSDLTKLRRRYLSSLGMLTTVSWPALAIFVILAEPVVLVLFGAKWLGTAPLAQILGLAAIVQAGSALSQQVHAALGQSAVILRREKVVQSLHIAILLCTAPFSAMAVAYGLLALSFFALGYNLTLLRREIGLVPTEYLGGIAKSATIAISTVGSLFIGKAITADWAGDPKNLSVLVAAASVGWLIAVIAVRSPLLAEVRGVLSSARWRRA